MTTKAQNHIKRLREIRHNLMLANNISRNELKSIINELSSIEDDNFKLVLSEMDYPYTEVKACIDITRVILLEQIAEIL